jgi:hypothetical protein
MSTESVDMKELTRRAYLAIAGAVVVFGAIFFLPVGTLDYLEAWAYWAS